MVPEDSKDLATKSSNPEAGSTCQVCRMKALKYKCPGCFVRTCSLPCVKAHKQSTGCNGKRQLTQFVPLDKFDDNLLISDYNLLEDVKRVAESAQRKRAKLFGDSEKLPFPLKSLQGAAASRRTKILFLAKGMSKRQTNQTCYNNRVDDDTSLSTAIMNHLEPGPFRHQLKRFCEEPLQSLKFYIQKFPGLKSAFVELDIEAPIREQLANIIIIEYPVIHVFLPSDHYEVTTVEIRQKIDHEKFIKNGEPSLRGVLIREEVIKEENSSDPKVLDVMKYAKKDGTDAVSLQLTRTEEKPADKLDSSSCATASEQERTKNDMFFEKALDEQLNFNVNSTVAEIIEMLDPEIVQGLLGSCSDMSESSFEDFFNLDGVFTEELGLLETNDQPSSSKVLPVGEELEEGEIPQ